MSPRRRQDPPFPRPRSANGPSHGTFRVPRLTFRFPERRFVPAKPRRPPPCLFMPRVKTRRRRRSEDTNSIHARQQAARGGRRGT